MGNVSPTPVKEKKPQKFENALDENSPLLPRNQAEVEHVNGFNGASFAGVVFNLSVFGLIVGIAMISFVAFLTGASIEPLLRFGETEKSVT